MIKGISKILTIVSFVLVFFLFAFSMPVGEDSPAGMVTGVFDDDVCSVFYTGHGSFYCEFGDITCERMLYEQCFGK